MADAVHVGDDDCLNVFVCDPACDLSFACPCYIRPHEGGLGMENSGKVLVHPQNRGGQMLSVEDVHTKGAKLLQVGIRKDLGLYPKALNPRP